MEDRAVCDYRRLVDTNIHLTHSPVCAVRVSNDYIAV